MLIDAHCHLDHLDDPLDVLERARSAGVEHLIVNGLWRAAGDFGSALALARAHPQRVSATVGIHPHDCAQVPEADFDRCASLAADPRIFAVGETGLDYHYDHSPRDRQREAFRWSIALARKAGKPLVIHVREADADAATLLREERAGEIGGQIHCFTGDRLAARTYLDLGFHLSFSGVVTFKNAQEIREAVKLTPLDRLLVETDSPYLAPLSYRGRKNEPAFIVETVRKLAEVLGMEVAQVAAATVENAIRLFSLGISNRPPA